MTFDRIFQAYLYMKIVLFLIWEEGRGNCPWLLSSSFRMSVNYEYIHLDKWFTNQLRVSCWHRTSPATYWCNHAPVCRMGTRTAPWSPGTCPWRVVARWCAPVRWRHTQRESMTTSSVRRWRYQCRSLGSSTCGSLYYLWTSKKMELVVNPTGKTAPPDEKKIISSLTTLLKCL